MNAYVMCGSYRISYLSVSEIDCNVNASPGITNVVCVSSKDLFLPPTCSLRMQGAETSVDFVCKLVTTLTHQSSLSISVTGWSTRLV